jgi:quercetin dioxygenase-like cupin family protein
MSLPPVPLPAGEAWPLESLVVPTPGGIASRVLARAGGGSATLFAFDAGQGLDEHLSPQDALVLVLAGALIVTLAGTPVEALPGTILRLPAGVPHAVEAREPSRMLLILLRDHLPA